MKRVRFKNNDDSEYDPDRSMKPSATVRVYSQNNTIDTFFKNDTLLPNSHNSWVSKSKKKQLAK